jgi:hypothetical protein
VTKLLLDFIRRNKLTAGDQVDRRVAIARDAAEGGK